MEKSMRKYTIVLMVLFLTVFIVACDTYQEDLGEYQVPAPKKEKYTTANKYYLIGSFDRETKQYDKQAMKTFIESIQDKFVAGDIISVDGLKWEKTAYGRSQSAFGPFPNPPIPVYEKDQESVHKHVSEYRQWIINHPHFGYPPLP
jgi:hypothetical protein